MMKGFSKPNRIIICKLRKPHPKGGHTFQELVVRDYTGRKSDLK